MDSAGLTHRHSGVIRAAENPCPHHHQRLKGRSSENKSITRVRWRCKAMQFGHEIAHLDLMVEGSWS